MTTRSPEALAAARAARNEAARSLPRCTLPMRVGPTGHSRRSGLLAHGTPLCGTRTIQNESERSRGVFWCPACAKYPWGNGGGRSGGGPDKVPAHAWDAAHPRGPAKEQP